MCRRTPGPATMASLSLSHPTSLVKCLGSVLISITPKGEVRLWNTCWAPEASHSQLSPHSPHTTPPTRGHRYHPPATLQGGIRTGKGFRPLGPGLQHSTGPATPASACPRHHSPESAAGTQLLSPGSRRSPSQLGWGNFTQRFKPHLRQAFFSQPPFFRLAPLSQFSSP